MKIYCCQFDIVWENKPANFARVKKLLDGAAIARGSLVLLPEMFSTGFSMNVPAIAEGKARPAETFLAQTAEELGVWLLGGVVTATADGRGRNESVVFSPAGKEAARYCKMQPFTLGGESQHYAAGSEVVTFNWQNFIVSPFVCYDLRFPELFRAAAQRGAQLMTVIADWPVARIHHWVTLIQARAIENQAYVAGVNRCGDDPKLKYSGRSLIVSPHGDILADAGDGEKVIGAELDLAGLVKWRADFPALQDMRPVRA
jgi:predicted amidohydrolase